MCILSAVKSSWPSQPCEQANEKRAKQELLYRLPEMKTRHLSVRISAVVEKEMKEGTLPEDEKP